MLREYEMTVNEGLRMLAGIMVLLSAALIYFVSEWFLLLTCFVGLNLLQSAFTRWCPAMTILAAIGFKKECSVESTKAQ